MRFLTPDRGIRIPLELGTNKSHFHGIDFREPNAHSGDIPYADGLKTMATLPNDIAMIAQSMAGLLPECAQYPGETRAAAPGFPIRLLLIESDPIAMSAVRAKLVAHGDFKIIAETSSGEEALRKICSLRPDAVLVDVATLEASGLNGADLLSLPARPLVVLLTTQRHYALQAFDLGAADFLVKPIRDDRFAITLDRLREQVSHRFAVARPVPPSVPSIYRRITVTDRRRTHVFETHDIEWISAAGDYTELHVHGATHLLREPLSVLLGRLPANVFCRIHRSFVVNLSRVSGFKTLRNQDLLVKLKDKTVLRASRTFSDDLRRALTQQCA
jgi:two-component system, LytTR family, response regulator